MIRSIYPVLMTEKLEESCAFYQIYFGFTETFSSDWYVSLAHPDGGELALIDARHGTIPASCQAVVTGMILNIEVDDAGRMFQEMTGKCDQVVIMPLQDEDYGQRHFMMQDPNGVIIDVIQEILPGEEYQDNYKGKETQ